LDRERSRPLAAWALVLAAATAGCSEPAPEASLSPTAEQDPARFAAAARETEAMEKSNREAERRLMKRSRIAPPAR
jgi:hypothetical protein